MEMYPIIFRVLEWIENVWIDKKRNLSNVAGGMVL